MSLEVEVGGYLPSAPSSVEESWGATFIPRPSFSPLHTSPSSPSHPSISPSHSATSPPPSLVSERGEADRGRERRRGLEAGEEGGRRGARERGGGGGMGEGGGGVRERQQQQQRGGGGGGGSRDRSEHVSTTTTSTAPPPPSTTTTITAPTNSSDTNSILTTTSSSSNNTAPGRPNSTAARNSSTDRSTSPTAIPTAAENEERNSTAEINNNSRSRRSSSNGNNSGNSGGGNSSGNRRNGQRNSRNSRSSSASTSSRPHLGVGVGVGCGRAGAWTHSHSGLMASLAVTLTTFNISRFAVLGARFGWPFVVQWCVVSAVLGLPLMTFHVTLGQYLGAGVVDMWVLSPVFQGVGYSVLLAQGLLGLYCCVPIAWLFIFFRDSFITHNNMFRWTDCRLMNCSIYNNFTTIIIEGVPKYFNSQVLQRGEGGGGESFLQELGTLKFDMAFNIALIWIITLLALSRGNQWYGKVSYVAILVPLLCYLVVCLYLAADTKDDLYINDVRNFSEFFMNSRSWMAASREVFLVWGLHSAVLQQMAAHNKRGHALYRDTTVLWVVTSLALVLAAVTGSSCVAGLHHNGLQYKPSSFETTESAQFLSEASDDDYFGRETLKWTRGHLSPRPRPEHLHHDNFYAGIRIRPPPYSSRLRQLGVDEESGYQSLRLATELFPALLAVNGAQKVSPFWSSLFYLSLLLFGIAQQLAVWRTVVEAVISLQRERLQGWETFITFLCCLFGFSAALPMATGAGIHILFFLDYVVSCGWWLMIIQLVQIFALLFVRGKPYSGQDIVSELLGRDGGCGWLWLGPLTSFSWNIIVPVGLLVLSISSFKSGQYREVFTWGGEGSYWPVWTCQLAAALQLLPILLVPLVGLAQTCRYLAATDDDLFDRIQRLYRPTLRSPYAHGRHAFLSPTESDSGGRGGDGQDETGETQLPRPYSDPPPKYTPPPSYSTATGARLAKLVNQSVRQSMRRLRASFRTTTTTAPATDTEAGQQQQGGEQRGGGAPRPYIPPPDYSTVTEYGSSGSAPPQYATLDPLRRQRALAALMGVNKAEEEAEGEGLAATTSTGLHRNTSLRGSGLGRSLASGVRRSARRLAATLGVGVGEDGAALVVSEANPPSQSTNSGHTQEDQPPYVYTNIELVSHSYA